jgi:hypothetical protein
MPAVDRGTSIKDGGSAAAIGKIMHAHATRSAKRHDHRMSPASSAARQSASARTSCPIEQHLAYRGAASTSRAMASRLSPVGGARPRRRSRHQSSFLDNLSGDNDAVRGRPPRPAPKQDADKAKMPPPPPGRAAQQRELTSSSDSSSSEDEAGGGARSGDGLLPAPSTIVSPSAFSASPRSFGPTADVDETDLRATLSMLISPSHAREASTAPRSGDATSPTNLLSALHFADAKNGGANASPDGPARPCPGGPAQQESRNVAGLRARRAGTAAGSDRGGRRRTKSRGRSRGSGGGARASRGPGKWSVQEDARLRLAVGKFGGKEWKKIAQDLGGDRTSVQCLHRWNKVLKPGLVKGPWTQEEDKVVFDMVTAFGVGNVKWSVIASHLNGRIGKQCRERWFNHLDPSIKKGPWTPEEDTLMFEAQQQIGNRWCDIAKLLPGRTENMVKNRWNSSARKKWFAKHGKTPGDAKGSKKAQLDRARRLAAAKEERAREKKAKEAATRQRKKAAAAKRAKAKPPRRPGRASARGRGRAGGGAGAAFPLGDADGLGLLTPAELLADPDGLYDDLGGAGGRAAGRKLGPGAGGNARPGRLDLSGGAGGVTSALQTPTPGLITPSLGGGGRLREYWGQFNPTGQTPLGSGGSGGASAAWDFSLEGQAPPNGFLPSPSMLSPSMGVGTPAGGMLGFGLTATPSGLVATPGGFGPGAGGFGPGAGGFGPGAGGSSSFGGDLDEQLLEEILEK